MEKLKFATVFYFLHNYCPRRADTLVIVQLGSKVTNNKQESVI